MKTDNNNFEICKQCILPSNYRRVKFNPEGICGFCERLDYTGDLKTVDPDKKVLLARQLHSTLLAAQNRGKYYDVAVGLSGGKDSAYLIYKLKTEYSLRILGIVIDHSYFNSTVEQNITKVSRILEIDTLYYRLPISFIDRFFTYKFKNYNRLLGSIYKRICMDCSDILEGNVMRLAAQLEIPIVLIGLSPEQTNRYFYEIPRDTIENNMIRSFYRDETFFTDNDRANLWNPKSDFEKNLRVFFPYHVWEYDVDEVVETLSTKGILECYESDPFNTECKILQALRHIYKTNLGYDPRIGPFSDLVRFGKASREEMIGKFYSQTDNGSSVDYVANRLNLNIEIELSNLRD